MKLFVVAPQDPDVFGIDQVVVVAESELEALDLAQDALDADVAVIESCEISTGVAMEMGEGRPYVG